MKISIQITERDIKKIIAEAISKEVGYGIKPDQIKIEVKSKQNYRAEWEVADFRAWYRNFT